MWCFSHLLVQVPVGCEDGAIKDSERASLHARDDTSCLLHDLNGKRGGEGRREGWNVEKGILRGTKG